MKEIWQKKIVEIDRIIVNTPLHEGSKIVSLHEKRLVLENAMYRSMSKQEIANELSKVDFLIKELQIGDSFTVNRLIDKKERLEKAFNEVQE